MSAWRGTLAAGQLGRYRAASPNKVRVGCSMKLFVWDMNGVLERGCDRVTIDISNEVLTRFGYGHRFGYEHSQILYGRTWSDYFAYLMPDEPPDRHRELQDACFALSAAQPQLLRRWMKPTPHAAAVLRDIAGAGHDQIVGDSPGDMPLSQVAGGVRYLFAHPGFEFRQCPADFRIRDLRQVLNHA
jgi:hypothetical protein